MQHVSDHFRQYILQNHLYRSHNRVLRGLIEAVLRQTDQMRHQIKNGFVKVIFITTLLTANIEKRVKTLLELMIRLKTNSIRFHSYPKTLSRRLRPMFRLPVRLMLKRLT